MTRFPSSGTVCDKLSVPFRSTLGRGGFYPSVIAHYPPVIGASVTGLEPNYFPKLHAGWHKDRPDAQATPMEVRPHARFPEEDAQLITGFGWGHYAAHRLIPLRAASSAAARWPEYGSGRRAIH